jgi:hypothetical protein
MANGKTAVFDARLAVLAFARRIDPKTLMQSLERLGLTLETFKAAPAQKRHVHRRLGPTVNHGSRRVWVRAIGRGRFGAELNDRIHAEFGNRLQWVGPAYRTAGNRAARGMFCPFPDVLIVRFDAKATAASVRRARQALEASGAREIAKKSRHLGAWQYWQISDVSRMPAMTLQRRLLERFANVIDRADFESMPLVRPIRLEPNDPRFSAQWNMQAIKAPQAWDVTTGSAGVAVAILDTGCDLGHQDLAFSSSGVNLGTMSGDGSPPDQVVIDILPDFLIAGVSGHGTCCAGIACGVVGNDRGVAGVAGNCRIIPIAFDNWTMAELAAGIDFSVSAGANALSMSIGWDSEPPEGFAMAVDALDRAHAAGLVLVAAAGNANKPSVEFPGHHPRVIACIASGKNDDRKRPGTDGEDWGSSFGDQASVAAPGVKIVTTDIRGLRGFAQAGDADYFNEFNGTSAATPHVAGLAALVISAFQSLAPAYQQRNAPLTNDEVRDIIEQTADKTGELGYRDQADKPNGAWNEQMGYGRINAERAVARVRERVTVSGHHRTVTPAWLAMMEIRRI